MRNISIKGLIYDYDEDRTGALDSVKFSKLVRGIGFTNERTAAITGAYDYLTMGVVGRKNVLTYLEFLKIFDRNTQDRELSEFTKKFKPIIHKIKIALGNQQTNIKDYMGKDATTANFYSKIGKLCELTPDDTTQLRDFADSIKSHSDAAEIDLDGLYLIIDSGSGGRGESILSKEMVERGTNQAPQRNSKFD